MNVIAHVVAQTHRGRRHRDQPGQQSRCHRGPAAGRREAARRRPARGAARPGASRDALHAGRGATVGADTFDLLLDHSRYDYDLFAPPNPALSTVDHAIGLHASAWCATAARCRSASASSATPSSIRCCCVTSRTRPGGARCTDAGTERSARAHRRRRRPRAVHHRPVRRHRDVRRPDARPVPRRHPAPARLRLSTAAARAGRQRLEHARRRNAARGPAGRGRRPACSARATSPRCRPPACCAARRRFDDGSIISPDGVRIEADLGNAEGARGARARMPGARAAGRHGHACRLPARAARVLCGAARAAGIRAAPVRHARRGLHQPALRRRSARCAWRSAATRAS